MFEKQKNLSNITNTKFIIILLLSLVIFSGCSKNYNKESKDTSNSSKKNLDKEVTILSVGDIMVHEEQLIAQQKKDGSYDFNNNFKYIKDIIKSSDFAIANLETTINPNKKYAGYPSFNTPSDILKAIKKAGFNLLSTINNHTLDTGSTGVKSTVDEIMKSGLENIGCKSDPNDKKYLVKDIKGINIGFAAFSYGDIKGEQKYLNGIPSRDAT